MPRTSHRTDRGAGDFQAEQLEFPVDDVASLHDRHFNGELFAVLIVFVWDRDSVVA